MKKYFIDEREVNEDEFDLTLEQEVDDYVEQSYDELLDDIYEPYKFGSFEICASEILSKCDPIAYRCGMSDEQSYQLEELQSELERYGECSVNGVEFKIEDDEIGV